MGYKHSDNIHQNVHSIDRDRLNALKKESTVALVRRIVEDSDKLALNVFLETRTLFRTGGDKPLLLHEYLSVLHENMSGNDFRYKMPNVTTSELADCVYDKTLNKYMSMPQQNEFDGGTDGKPSKKKAVDCRNYYRAFLNIMQKRIDKGEIKTREAEEVQSGILLQILVKDKFFSSSLMDCRRELSPSIRYKWKVGGGKLYLWRPRHVEIAEFKEWLNTRIKDVDLQKPKEKQRIQSLVDKHFGSVSLVPIAEDREGVFPGSYKIATHALRGGLSGSNLRHLELSNLEDSLEVKQKQMFPGSLAEAVAGEKVANIEELRPAIIALGKEALERLILKIFSDLAEQGDYELSQLAREYEISKSTLSRFAGTKWEEDKDSGVKYIPDLWQNTAEILGKYPVLMETASASGFAGQIKKVLEFIKP